MALNVFNLYSYGVECLRHSHSTWMFMPLNDFNLDIQAVECLRHNHSTWMVMPLNACLLHKHLTFFGINIQLGWLCR
jgi:hypothetical protein